MPPIKVLLAEDHKIVREGTRQLLQQAGDLTIVGEAEDGRQAVDLALRLRPDVVVLDMRLPELSGLQATQRIKEALPGTRVLILSAYENEAYVIPALEAGADGYLLKTSGGKDLIQAIQNVYRGQMALDPQVAGKVVGQLSARRQPYRSGDMVEALTGREMDVLRALASGKSNKEIAEALMLSVYTVQVHLRNIFAKLGVSSRTEALAYALRQGWISLGQDS